MQSAVWLLLEQQISTGDSIPVEIGFSESNRSTNTESEGETEPENRAPLSLKTGALGDKLGVPFCLFLKCCWCTEKDFAGHGLVPSLNGLVTAGCVRAGGTSAADCCDSLAVEMAAFAGCPPLPNQLKLRATKKE